MTRSNGDLLIDRILQNAIDNLVISYWYYNGTYHVGKYDHKNKTEYQINIQNIEIKENKLNEYENKTRRNASRSN